MRAREVDPQLDEFATAVGSAGPVCVAGGRTQWAVGGTPARGTTEVEAPSGIVAYAPEEMTVAVYAGTPVAVLHEELRSAAQRTVLPDFGGSTVGGVLAVGHDDIHRLGRGLLRDVLLQARYVSAEGRLVTAGGPTVKNVSGFDLCRVLVGALGTLGLIGEVILRTRPIPGAAVWYRSDDVDPFGARDALMRASSILWDGTSTWIHIEGHPGDVEAQHAALAQTVGTGALAEAAGPPELPPHRWSLRPRELRDLVGAGDAGEWVAEIGVGVVHRHQPPAAPAADPARDGIHRRLKAEFDPAGRLNPGRDPRPWI